MTRAKALEAMDRLADMGYTVSLRVRNLGDHGYVDAACDPEDGRTYDVVVMDLSMDSMDLRSLVELADSLELDVGLSAMAQGHLRFADKRVVHEAVSGRRPHPR